MDTQFHFSDRSDALTFHAAATRATNVVRVTIETAGADHTAVVVTMVEAGEGLTTC